MLHRRGLCRKHYTAWRATQLRGVVDAAPVRRHVKALLMCGMTHQRLSELAGVSRVSTIQPLLYENRATMRANTAAKLLAVPIPDSSGPGLGLSRLVRSEGTVRRLRALIAIGYRQDELQGMLRCSAPGLSLIMNGGRGLVRVGFAVDVDRVFQQCQLVPRSDVRSINRAKRLGWVPPLAWDEDTIDDPDAEPILVERSGDDDWFGTLMELRELGLSDRDAAERMGLKLNTLASRLRRLAEAA